MLPNYSPLLRRLGYWTRRAGLCGFLVQHNRPLPDGGDDRALAAALLDTLDSLIDTHVIDLDYLLDEVEEEGREFELESVFLEEVVHLSGLSEELEWDGWSSLWHFAFCLTWVGGNGGFCPDGGDVDDWWSSHAEALALPPLSSLAWDDIMENLRDLPEPWNGLDAMLSWVLGDTGNIFVDIPCEYAYEVLFSWRADDLNLLVSQYQEAELEIFGPARDLEAEYQRHPARTLSRCVDLALGRNCFVQDGEVIWLAEPEEILQPINSEAKGELMYV